jgi:hypothetical protein
MVLLPLAPVSIIASVNGLVDRGPGFAWRLQAERSLARPNGLEVG